MHHPYRRFLLSLALTLPSIGCAGALRPAKTAAPTAIHPKTPFADYLRANRFGRWVYQRTEVEPASNRPPIQYPRHITAARLQEGILERQQLLPLNRYLESSDQPAAYPLGRNRWGVFFDLLEPMDPLPPELESGRPISTSTTIRYYDQTGRRIDVGTLTREAQIVGLETVECPAGTFENCLRIRVDLLIHFRWGPHVDWKGTVWLSPQVGEVKRVQHMTGWYWIFFFGSAHEYRLASYEPLPTATRTAVSGQAWVRAAMVLDRVIPHPQIAGITVDFADPTAAMTKPGN